MRRKYRVDDAGRGEAGQRRKRSNIIGLAGNAAAREDALLLARELKHGAVMPGWDWSGWFVTIVDSHGQKVDEVPIVDA